MSREKRPSIDEGQRNLILSRLFGENYASKQEDDDFFLGYIDGVICEVLFSEFICSVRQIEDDLSAVKFGNLVMNKFFSAKGLRCTTCERINFDNTTCVSVHYDKINIVFCFWYRFKDKEK